MSKKFSERFVLTMTYEMRQWLTELAKAGNTDRSTVMRGMLQSIMDDDQRANERPAKEPDGYMADGSWAPGG